MKTLSGFCAAILFLLPNSSLAQVNSGSDGHDGVFNPTQNVTINMADHPDGIYHFTSVNIPTGVTVTFTPNADNSQVIWLIQGDCTIAGSVNLSGAICTSSVGALGGPGGFRGGNLSSSAGPGQGPGGGTVGISTLLSGNASFGSAGACDPAKQNPSGDIYGNAYLLPLIGGSGGGGPGGGGGGAILIAASGTVRLTGNVQARGVDGLQIYNSGTAYYGGGGGGSGGAIRFVTTAITGNGTLAVPGGYGRLKYSGSWDINPAGNGRVRIDALSDTFSGSVQGAVTRGFQPIIIPPANQAVSLAILSVGGVAVAANPNGQLTTPDVIVPAAQQNPVSIVVSCTNIPLNTEIIVDVKPANGATVRAVGLNSAGTQASSTATVQVTMPRGGGTIQAKAVSGLSFAANDDPNAEHRSMAQTGLTADGERFAKMEITTALGGKQQIAYLTVSGKRYAIP